MTPQRTVAPRAECEMKNTKQPHDLGASMRDLRVAIMRELESGAQIPLADESEREK
jgi:hypothetical protein